MQADKSGPTDDDTRKMWMETKRQLGLRRLESDPYANIIPGRVRALSQRLRTLMLPLIGKSSQEAQDKWLALMDSIIKEAIYIHVALRLNRSKCTWHWPKAHETFYSRSSPEELVGKKLFFVAMPTVTATLPQWEQFQVDFRIWGECWWDEVRYAGPL